MNDAMLQQRVRAARTLALTGLAVCVGAIVLLGWFTVYEGKDRWLESTELSTLRAQLEKAPNTDTLKATVRRRDQALRRQYFLNRRRRIAAGWVLLASAVLALYGLHWGSALASAKTPALPPPPEEEARVAERRRRTEALALACAVAVLLLAGIGLGVAGLWTGLAERRRGAPATRDVLPQPPAPPPSLFGSDAWKNSWPQFRGPTGMGLTAKMVWPTVWNVKDGSNIAWTAPLPETPGNSSPLVWGRRIFITSATSRAEFLHCLSVDDGAVVWTAQVQARRADPAAFEKLEVMEETGYAAPTPACDGHRVFVTFATADIAAFDFDGNQVWAWNAGPPDSAYGLASSLAIYQDLVLWQLDQGSEASAGKSRLYALDGRTGKPVWQTPRPVPASWSTPVVAPATGGYQVLTAGSPFVIAYDPKDGREIWRAKVLSGDVAPAPVVANTIAFATAAGAEAAAIRMDGRGDITKTHVLWTAYDGLPDTASPLTNGQYFLQAGSDGEVSCYNAHTGKLLWDQVFDCGFQASPVLAGDLVYLFGDDGTVLLFALAAKYELRRKLTMGEPIRATPAFVGGRIYVRGEKHLICIGPAPASVSEKKTGNPPLPQP